MGVGKSFHPAADCLMLTADCPFLPFPPREQSANLPPMLTDFARPSPLVDGRQSPDAAAVQRGVGRLLRAQGFAMVTELPLATGRRADVVAIGGGGELWIVEIKSSIQDFRVDQKWPDYSI